MNNLDALMLLSGGLDSFVTLGFLIKKQKIKNILALTFDYGQKPFEEEAEASKKIVEYFNIKHEIIKLDFLKKMQEKVVEKNILTSETLDNRTLSEKSAKNVWVPNRNGLFLNIAACFCDFYKIDKIAIGINREEGQTFPDNTSKFQESAENLFLFSTLQKPKVIAPLKEFSKDQIVALAIELNLPLNIVFSCYFPSKGKHCGKCESCLRLKRALQNCDQAKLLSELFKD